jgi:hypothetical protein
MQLQKIFDLKRFSEEEALFSNADAPYTPAESAFILIKTWKIVHDENVQRSALLQSFEIKFDDHTCSKK